MSYGLCAYLIFGFSAMQIGYLPDISCDRRFVFDLAYRCTTKQVSPTHLFDVVSDALL